MGSNDSHILWFSSPWEVDLQYQILSGKTFVPRRYNFPVLLGESRSHVSPQKFQTDPFRSGQTILIGKTHQPVCPIQAMKAYLSIWNPTPGPLFKYVTGKPLTKEALTSETRQLFPNLVLLHLNMQVIAIG